MSTAIATREQPTGGALAMWDAEQLEIITKLICPDATPAELALFGQVCQRTGLDPFARQVYGIKRKGRLSIQTGIDGFRLQAQRSKDYAGQEGPQWCGEDGVWREVWLSKEYPSAARVGVYRKGWTKPVWGVATWNEYAQIYNGRPTDMWASMPANQLAKCAEAQALRKAFPAELSGLYSTDEMDQSENTEPAYTPSGSGASAPVEGQVVGDVPVWVATYHQKWAAGAARANQIGAEIPNKTDPSEGGKACEAAIRKLAENIKAKERENLEQELRDVVDAANAAAGTDFFEVPEDLAEKSNDEVREMIGAAQSAIPTTEAA